MKRMKSILFCGTILGLFVLVMGSRVSLSPMPTPPDGNDKIALSPMPTPPDGNDKIALSPMPTPPDGNDKIALSPMPTPADGNDKISLSAASIPEVIANRDFSSFDRTLAHRECGSSVVHFLIYALLRL